MALFKCLFKSSLYLQKDKQYLVHQGQVVIIDEHSGRPAFGRRWGDGLHQALEAKERRFRCTARESGVSSDYLPKLL